MEITPAAKDAIFKFLKTENVKNVFRVKVETGGCSGLSYKTEIGLPLSDDIIVDGRIVTNEVSQPLLQNLILDYTDTISFSGFTFTNPDAKGTCGCGISFDI